MENSSPFPDLSLARILRSKYRHLLRSLAFFLKREDVPLIRLAFSFLIENQNGKERDLQIARVGEAIEITRVAVEEIGLGVSSTIATLLFQASIDRGISRPLPPDFLSRFDQSEKDIYQGLVKLSGINFSDKKLQDENLRRLLLTLAKDPRVVLIRLAERMVFMRSLQNPPREELVRACNENSFLYIPLAHHLGLYYLKLEMEDIALRFLDPDTYQSIRQKLEDSSPERDRYIENFLVPIKLGLDQRVLRYSVKWRTKSINSILNKMKKKQVEFEEVFDLFAIRIILESPPEEEKTDCWKAYSIVADIYTPNPSRLRDWISVPKSNGYESLQTTVMGPGGKWVEIQIRSQRMDAMAEIGLAAHWRYKGGKADDGLNQWLSRVRNLIENQDVSSFDLFKDLQDNLGGKEVFVFTPQGQVKKLPVGATALDFAFEVHSEVGTRCVSAKVNHKFVPLKHPLNNGDQVEVFTSRNQKPKKDWLRMVITTKARNKIKKFLEEEKFRHAEIGKEEFHRKLRNWKIPLTDELFRQILKHFKLKIANDFYGMIATGVIEASQLKPVILGFGTGTAPVSETAPRPVSAKGPDSGDFLIIEQNLKNVNFHFGKCCNPIFGDEIFGFVTIGKGISVHRTSCPNAQSLLSRYHYRLVKTRWADNHAGGSFVASLKLTGTDEIGLVNSISNIISNEMKLNMKSISINSESGKFDGFIKVLVENIDQLNALLNRLTRIKGIDKATRIE